MIWRVAIVSLAVSCFVVWFSPYVAAKFLGGRGSVNGNLISLSSTVFTTAIPSTGGTVASISGSGSCTGPFTLAGTDGAKFQVASSTLETNGTGAPAGSPVSYSITVNGSNCASRGVILSLVEMPGPSAALWANPYYACSRNFYVATTGNDSNSGTSSGSPWLTIAHADSSSRVAGDCVNVAAGSYTAFNQALQYGGSSAASTGYVVYRCSTLDGCIINPGGSGSGACAGSTCGNHYPNYLIFDGFDFTSSAPTTNFAVAILCQNGNTGTVANGCHHWWVINSIASDFGQGGIGLNDTEFLYAVHNTVTGNANQCNGIYGSGIGFVSLKVVSGYTETADDKNNPTMDIWGANNPFHAIVAFNNVYNNYQGCGPPPSTGYTDGNCVIFDSLGTQNGNTVSYTQPTLIAFNVTYNCGGGGVHIFASEDVTAANNSSYNNGINPNGPFGSYALDTSQSYSSTLINNIGVSIPAAVITGSCASYVTTPFQTFNSAIFGGPPVSDPANSYNSNVTQLQGGNDSCWGTNGFDGPTGENPMFNADAGQYSCSSNKCATSPGWVNVGNSSTGSDSTPPVGANFSLQSSSPAIGYGQTEPYLSSQAADAGACYHTLSACP